MARKDGEMVQVPALNKDRTVETEHRKAQVASRKESAEAICHGWPGHFLAMCLYNHASFVTEPDSSCFGNTTGSC